MGESNGVRWTIDGAQARVVFDLPPVNIVGSDLIVGLSALLPALAEAEIGVAVFRSADPDFFLMHGDVEMLVQVPASEPVTATAPNVASVIFQQLHTAPYLTIGVVDGAARGGGCELLSALDLRIGSPRAVVGQPEVPMGIIPGAGGTTRWPWFAGRARALEIILTGRDLDAREALEVGWLDELLPADELDERVDALAARVASMPPASIAAVKRVVDRSLVAGVGDDALTLETDEMGRLTAAGAHIEPMRRFLAAGGQTREVERGSIEPLIEAMRRG